MKTSKKHLKLQFIIRAAISWLLLKPGSRPYRILVKQLKNHPKIYFYLRATISWLLLKPGSRPCRILVKQLKNHPKIYFYLIVPIIKTLDFLSHNEIKNLSNFQHFNTTEPTIYSTPLIENSHLPINFDQKHSYQAQKSNKVRVLVHIHLSSNMNWASTPNKKRFCKLLHDLKARSFEVSLLINKTAAQETVKFIEIANNFITEKNIYSYSNIEITMDKSNKLCKLSTSLQNYIISQINPDHCIAIFLTRKDLSLRSVIINTNKKQYVYDSIPRLTKIYRQQKLCSKKSNISASERRKQKNQDWQQLARDFTSLSKPQEKILAANCITQNFQPAPVKKQLLFDIWEIISVGDLGTGIQRVVRSQLFYLLQNPPAGFAVYPVFLSKHKGYHFRHAYEKLKDLNWSDNLIKVPDLPIDYFPGDILYVPDIIAGDMIAADHIGLFDLIKLNKVTIFSYIYDILPYTNPEYFPQNTKDGFSKWLNCVFKISDSVISCSQATLNQCRAENNLLENQTTCLPLGATTEVKQINIQPLQKISNTSKSITLFNFPLKTKAVNFLMVGTIEPRKGHYQVLCAFDKLWQEGYSVNLIIVGKSGWTINTAENSRFNINALIKRIKNHSRLNKNLFLYQGLSDTELKTCYQNSSCLIMASEAEGFGLPLIEASKYKLPIIARDIPVFKEITKDNAFYFNNDLTENTIFSAVKDWLMLYKSNQHPKSENIHFMNWEQHTDKLADIFVTHQPSKITVDLKKTEDSNV